MNLFLRILLLAALPVFGGVLHGGVEVTYPYEVEAEEEFRELLLENFELSKRMYSKIFETQGGRILAVDLARKLYAPYTTSKQGAIMYSDSLQGAGREFISRLLMERIDEVAAAEVGAEIVFLCGGCGAGKTTSYHRNLELFENAKLIYDGTLSRYDTSKAMIDYAISKGMKVRVVYVYRDVEESFQGMIKRADKSGRYVPLRVMASSHYQSQKTFLRLILDFDRLVDFVLLDNRENGKCMIEAAEIANYLEQNNACYLKEEDVSFRLAVEYMFMNKPVLGSLVRELLEEGMAGFDKYWSRGLEAL